LSVEEGFKVSTILFYGRAYSFTLRCTASDVTSLSFNKEVTKKMNSDVPSEPSLDIAALQNQEINIYAFYAVLQILLPRAADVPRQKVLRAS
jgi:hypothetical protein